MERSSIEKIIGKVNEMTENCMKISDSNTDAKEEDLFTESIEAFSTEPLAFEEVSARLLNKVEELFDLSARYNRHVPQYVECCAWLEKGLKLLGSAALTKFVLERRKFKFTLLDQLSMPKLYRMASFNFRKIDTALTEAISGKKPSVYKLLDMEYRFYHLLDRLKATEEKIYRITICTLSENNFVRRALMLTEKSWNRVLSEKTVKPPVFRKTTAFPIDNEAVREYEGANKPENHDTICPAAGLSAVHPAPETDSMTAVQMPKQSAEPQSAAEASQAEGRAHGSDDRSVPDASGKACCYFPDGQGALWAGLNISDKWRSIFGLQDGDSGSIPPGRV